MLQSVIQASGLDEFFWNDVTENKHEISTWERCNEPLRSIITTNKVFTNIYLCKIEVWATSLFNWGYTVSISGTDFIVLVASYYQSGYVEIY
jgi:hypothetical protein